MNGASRETPARILVAADFRPSTDEALRQAHAWAAAISGRLDVCHVVPEPLQSNPLFPQNNEEEAFRAVEWEHQVGDLLAERVAEITGRTEGDFDVRVDAGAPEAVILGEADEIGANLIVLASEPSSKGGNYPLGHVEEHVIRFAHCAVLLARPHARTGQVLAATDLSDPSLPAVLSGAAEAKRRGAHLTVLHNLDPLPSAMPPVEMTLSLSPVTPLPLGLAPLPAADLRARADARVRSLLAEHQISGDCLITEGEASDEIARVATELDAELVVVGTHGRSGWLRATLGSVARRAAEAVSCPVLVVRLGQRPGDRPSPTMKK